MFFKVMIDDIMWIMMMLWWMNTSFVCLFDMIAQNFVPAFVWVYATPKMGSPEEGDNFFYKCPNKTDEKSESEQASCLNIPGNHHFIFKNGFVSQLHFVFKRKIMQISWHYPGGEKYVLSEKAKRFAT